MAERVLWSHLLLHLLRRTAGKQEGLGVLNTGNEERRLCGSAVLKLLGFRSVSNAGPKQAHIRKKND